MDVFSGFRMAGGGIRGRCVVEAAGDGLQTPEARHAYHQSELQQRLPG